MMSPLDGKEGTGVPAVLPDDADRVRDCAVKISSRLCLGSDIGNSGNMYGGRLLYLMDEAGAIYAMQTACEPRMVSRRFSEIQFSSPVHPGEILEFYALHPRKGNTSFSFDIEVRVEGVPRFHASCTFVAVDENGRKKVIDWSKTPLASL